MGWRLHAVLTVLGLVYLWVRAARHLVPLPAWFKWVIKGYLLYTHVGLSTAAESSRAIKTTTLIARAIAELRFARINPLPNPGKTSTEPPSPSYSYKPLRKDGEIRLLQFLPVENGNHDSPLTCQLRHFPLFKSPDHYALSYCWDDRHTEDHIENEEPSVPEHTQLLVSSDGAINITQNLANALREIRRQSPTIWLWVDQVCINQLDNAEKSKQIVLMRKIYSTATQVLVWLGDDADKCVSRACELANALEPSIDKRSLLSNTQQLIQMDDQTCADYGIPPLIEAVPGYAALITLLNHPWFVRAWVVQEVAYDNAWVVSTELKVPLLTLVKALYFCLKSLVDLVPTMRPDANRALLSLLNTVAVGHIEAGGSLLHVLSRHRCRYATLPQDKVFAFLGAADDIDRLKLSPDYTLPAHTVFIETAVAILQTQDNLDILSVAKPIVPESDDPALPASYTNVIRQRQNARIDPSLLPSWVPNWDVALIGLALRRKDANGSYIYPFDATSGSTPTLQFRLADNKLGVSGYVFDEIAKVGDVHGCAGPLSVYTKFHVFTQWEKLCSAWSNRVYECTGENMWTAYTYCVTLGGRMVQPFDFDEHEQADYVAKEYLTYRFAMRNMAIIMGLGINPGNSPMIFGALFALVTTVTVLANEVFKMLGISVCSTGSISQSFTNLLTGSSGRRLLVTKGGLIGLTVPDAQPGDRLALLAGSAVPIVLRPKDHGSETCWEIVGDAYVHGVMHGERFDGPQCGTLWIV
ncbi:unnamed protein product [Parascedosporium putredinis]|uniref:Heterokaryon incompatibility domain-containing protein n=1 Tax=Parascedosporium putredinis TaxID=1442378 RepID=A0A9P1MGA3_9PEZI|nr:unnamed protein product [Parascedosporium putredinis]CAI8005039.1 unnamed protein product [Parascedosporium putredinis]